MTRQRNLSFDALVKATGANPKFEGGQLGKALQAIMECCEDDGIPPEDVPKEIALRAEYYHRLWPHLTLTPPALARHWYRVLPKKDTFSSWEERFGDEGGG